MPTSLELRRDNSGRIIYRIHPNGWVIRRKERDWDARGLGGMTVGPKTYWEVKRHFRSSRPETFWTLREAISFCDDNPNPGRQS